MTISNGNGTEWSPIRSVIIRVITKSDDWQRESVLFIRIDYSKITITEKRRMAKL